MNTRRDFVRGLTGIGAIVATGNAPAIVRSMIAARAALTGMKGETPMKKIVLTQNCTNCAQLSEHIVAMLAAEGIKNAMCFYAGEQLRQNLVGIISIVNGTYSSYNLVLRYRNGTWGTAQSGEVYDANNQIGDVFNVYVPEGPWNA